MNWFKFYGQEYLTDPKMMNLTPTEKALWLTMLCLASQDNGTIRYVDSEKIMILTGIMPDEEDFKKYYDFLTRFEKLQMITNDNETICITNYDKRQNSNLTPYERVKKWREKSSENKEKTKQWQRKSRGKSFGNSDHFILDEWEELKDEKGHTCNKCNRCEPEIILTPDHIIPLSKGGKDTIDNIQPLCSNCNQSKGSNVDDNIDDNDREDKIRIDKNIKKEKKESKLENSLSYLENIPQEDIAYFTSTWDCSEKQLKQKGLALVDWCKSNNKRKSDYKAFLRNAIRKDFKEKPQTKDKPEYEIDSSGLARIKDMKSKFNLN